MKFRHFFWPVILIALGLLILLCNLGIVDFGWRIIWNLWPLILIFWGIAVLPIKDLYKSIAVIIILAFTVTFFNRLTEHTPWWSDHSGCARHYDWNDDEDNTSTGNYEEQNLSIPPDSLTKRGILDLDAAAGTFTVEGVTSDFLTFKKSGDIGNYSLTTRDTNGVKKISLSLEKEHVRHSIHSNKVDIRVNEKPSWKMVFNVGAADMKLDLTSYIVDTISVDAGASSIKMKLGDKSPCTRVSLNAGASSIKVEVPQGTGCQINSESFLISRNFKGFDKKGDRMYQTSNFNSSSKKIYITIETAVSSIEVNRY
jgi:energy-coupling factor transporter transmembrane protein EcfT